MEPNHLNQQQTAQAYSQQQQQPQLPDESYIEKLFPKCQPKQPQVRTASNQFRNKRTIRTDRQQQHKRQIRAKQQYQQHQPNHHHHQQQQHQQQRHQHQLQPNQPQQQQAHHDSGPRRTKSNAGGSLMENKKHKLNSDVAHTNSGILGNARHDYNSSDSSEKDANVGGSRSDLASVRRSVSSHAFPANNKQYDQASPVPIPSYNKPRTKKHRASKNLQQQLKRSQSSYSKMFSLQQLPIDPSDRANVSCDESKEDSPDKTIKHDDQNNNNNKIQPSQSNNKPNYRANGTSNGRGSLKEPQDGRKVERGNRTSRGIVFSEPISTTNEEEDYSQTTVTRVGETTSTSSSSSPPPISQPAIPSQSSLSSSSATGLSQADGGNEIGAAPTNQAPSPVKARQHAQQGQASSIVSNNTADSGQSKTEPEEDSAKINDVVTNIHPLENYTNSKPNKQQEQHANHTENHYIESGACETTAKSDNTENDDRFINLFVYDNSLPRKYEDQELDKTSLITTDQQQQQQQPQDRVAYITEARQQEIKTSTRPLLGLDEDEEDIVSNDTSTEELCSYSGNDADNGIKIKSILRPTKRTLDDVKSRPADKGPDVAPQILNKSMLKHHRSMSTLQTVDENAEINIDEEDNNDGSDNTNSAKTIQLDSSESTMIKKSLIPPGFPQRVRPTPVESNPEESTPCPQTSPTHVPPSPISDDIATKRSNPNSDVPNHEEASEKVEKSSCILLDNIKITEESRNAIEKNLSEALNKVSLGTNIPTLRQLKLPNEASHFSAVRPAMTKSQSCSSETQHHPSIQFNTLSDAESGADDESNLNSRHGPGLNKPQVGPKRQDFTPSVMRYASPGSSSRVDDDLTPPTRTALVFPRLDEGLSSEAESCDDEVDDDDDKAMEADVEADDDDDEDDDVDDNPTLNLNKDSSSIQANVDSFQQRQQQQSMKHGNRRTGNLQSAPGGAQSRLPELNQVKFNDFNGQETLDQEDLKPIANYANQNGQSNYWLSGASQHAAMSSQPSSFSRMQLNSNASNNVNLSRSNSYANRDDVKTANRLSSDTDNETDRLLGSQRNDQLQKVVNNELTNNNTNDHQTTNNFSSKQGTNSREVLIEGVLFNVKYLGSTHTECEGRGEKEDRIHQAELAVHEVKFRNGETHSPIEVQLFISTEKIMVLDDKHRKIMMDHSLRTISYIADIGDAIVLIVRKKSTSIDSNNDLGRPISKTSCHVFESNESHTITKSISQAFQVAYTELLKANGAGDGSNYLPKELDYQEVLNSQEMSTTELEIFARKENQREVIVPKKKGEILGLSIVESGWGSVLPTAVIASLKQDGPAYRCKKLSVGDQILSINGISLVGLSLAECQKILRKTKYLSVARLSVVPCPITVEVKIKRPDTKYQLGFSVQHGVICSLLRGGIAERGGVRVGHRIISINGTTVVGVPHDKIVTLLASSVGEIRMKTCLTSLYRHMLGEEKNVSFV